MRQKGLRIRKRVRQPHVRPKKDTTKRQIGLSPYQSGDTLLSLQQTIGNRAVEGLINSGEIRAKLKMRRTRDKYEQEAEWLAEKVMRMVKPGMQRERKIEGGPVQAKFKIGKEELIPGEGNNLMREEIMPVMESKINSIKGCGQPLPESVRSYFEPRFGINFSQIRLHTDSQAANITQSVNAKAFSTGKDVFFNTGQYAPGIASGKRLLAHELTHVVQQNKNYLQKSNFYKNKNHKAKWPVRNFATTKNPVHTHHHQNRGQKNTFTGKRLFIQAKSICPCDGGCPGCLPVQPKPKIDKPDDKYEQEADRVAERVINMPGLQMKVQDKKTPTTVNSETHLQNGLFQGEGKRLPLSTRLFFESRFGRNFYHVRVHAGSEAHQLAKYVNAKAFTIGNNVVFGEGYYKPETKEGQMLLGHKLVHVIQQGRNFRHKGIEYLRTPSNRIQRLTIEDCGRTHFHGVAQACAMARQSSILRTVKAILAYPLGWRARNELIRYFGRSGPRHRVTIAWNLMKIRYGLGSATIECEYPGSWFYNYFCPRRRLGYVRTLAAFLIRWANIHACQPQFHNAPPRTRMATIVHEGAHRYIIAWDYNAYYDRGCGQTAATRRLTDSQRRNHADSYSCLVYRLGW